LKLRKEVPELNLKCEEMLFKDSKDKQEKDRISLIELNSNDLVKKKEPRFFSNQKNSNDEETEAELKRIEKLEKMMESLSGNVQIMNEELKMLKSSIYKKQSGDQNLINRKINENRKNNVNSTNRISESKIPHKENRLKMKTFNDLELDLNLSKSQGSHNDIKQEDFLKNILNITRDDLIKTKEEIDLKKNENRVTKMKPKIDNTQSEKLNDKKSKVK
jgi:hypothetical protein